MMLLSQVARAVNGRPSRPLAAENVTGVSTDTRSIRAGDLFFALRGAIKLALQCARKDDVVLIAGKGHETYQIFKDRTIGFDDRQIAREILGELAKK